MEHFPQDSTPNSIQPTAPYQSYCMDQSYSFTILMSKLNIRNNNFQEYMNHQTRWEQELLDDLQWMVSPFTIKKAITSGNIIFATDSLTKIMILRNI